MVELVYVGDPGRSHTDPPVGQLEPGARIHAEDDVAQRLLATGNFEIAHDPEPSEEPVTAPEKGRKSKPADTTAQED